MSSIIESVKNNITEYFENAVNKYKNMGKQVIELFYDTNEKPKPTKDKLIELFYDESAPIPLSQIIHYIAIVIAVYLSFKCNEDNSLNFTGLVAALCCPECYIIYTYYSTDGEMCGIFDFYTGKKTEPPYTVAGKALYAAAHPEEALRKLIKANKKPRMKLKKLRIKKHR